MCSLYLPTDGDFETREEKLQNARDMLENLMNDVEEGAFLDMGKGQGQEMEGADGEFFTFKVVLFLSFQSISILFSLVFNL